MGGCCQQDSILPVECLEAVIGEEHTASVIEDPSVYACSENVLHCSSYQVLM